MPEALAAQISSQHLARFDYLILLILALESWCFIAIANNDSDILK
jgi:hypothetical protein